MATASGRGRFSLNNLVILVTLATCGLGWSVYQINWIQQRRAARDGGTLSCFPRCTPLSSSNPYDVAPWSLRIFGEEPAAAEAFFLPDDTPDPEVQRIKSLFPETRVCRSHEIFDGKSTMKRNPGRLD